MFLVQIALFLATIGWFGTVITNKSCLKNDFKRPSVIINDATWQQYLAFVYHVTVDDQSSKGYFSLSELEGIYSQLNAIKFELKDLQYPVIKRHNVFDNYFITLKAPYFHSTIQSNQSVEVTKISPSCQSNYMKLAEYNEGYSLGDPFVTWDEKVVPYGCWFYPMKGSGIFVKVGKVLNADSVVELHNQLNLPCHDSNCYLPNGNKYWCQSAIDKGYDAIHVFNLRTQSDELIICSGKCGTVAYNSSCPPIELRTGLNAELSCTCNPTLPILNCGKSFAPPGHCECNSYSPFTPCPSTTSKEVDGSILNGHSHGMFTDGMCYKFQPLQSKCLEDNPRMNALKMNHNLHQNNSKSSCLLSTPIHPIGDVPFRMIFTSNLHLHHQYLSKVKSFLIESNNNHPASTYPIFLLDIGQNQTTAYNPSFPKECRDVLIQLFEVTGYHKKALKQSAWYHLYHPSTSPNPSNDPFVVNSYDVVDGNGQFHLRIGIITIDGPSDSCVDSHGPSAIGDCKQSNEFRLNWLKNQVHCQRKRLHLIILVSHGNIALDELISTECLGCVDLIVGSGLSMKIPTETLTASLRGCDGMWHSEANTPRMYISDDGSEVGMVDIHHYPIEAVRDSMQVYSPTISISSQIINNLTSIADDNNTNQWIHSNFAECSSSDYIPDGTLIRYQRDKQIYIIDRRIKRPIPSLAVFSKYGYQFSDVKVVSDINQVEKFPTGPNWT